MEQAHRVYGTTTHDWAVHHFDYSFLQMNVSQGLSKAFYMGSYRFRQALVDIEIQNGALPTIGVHVLKP